MVSVAAIVMACATISATAGHALAAAGCAGDCDGDERVTVDELILAVNIALGQFGLDACPAADRNGDRLVTVDELVAGVSAALAGCPPSPTPTLMATVGSTTTGTPSNTPTLTATPSGVLAIYGATHHSLLEIGSEDGAVLSEIEIGALSERPWLGSDGQRVFILQPQSSMIFSVDPRTGVVAQIATPCCTTGSITPFEDQLYILLAQDSQLFLATFSQPLGLLVKLLHLPPETNATTVVDRKDSCSPRLILAVTAQSLLEIDADTGAILRTVEVGPLYGQLSIVSDGESAFVAQRGFSTIIAIDLRTLTIQRIGTYCCLTGSLAISGGFLYVMFEDLLQAHLTVLDKITYKASRMIRLPGDLKAVTVVDVDPADSPRPTSLRTPPQPIPSVAATATAGNDHGSTSSASLFE